MPVGQSLQAALSLVRAVWSPYLPAPQYLQPYSVAALCSWYLPLEHLAQADVSPVDAHPVGQVMQSAPFRTSPDGHPVQISAPCEVQSSPVAAVPVGQVHSLSAHSGWPV